MKLEGRQNLQAALATLSSLKDNVPDRITGALGRYDETGQKQVQVYKEDGVTPVPGYVWVRINGRPSEVIKAYNESSLDTWDLPVILERDPKRPRDYTIIGKQTGIYQNWGNMSNLGKHGDQHSFSSSTSAGRDIVWVYRRQLVQPLLCHPKSTPDWTVYVEPDIYLNSTGNFVEWPGGDIDLSIYQPTDYLAKFVTVYLDSATNTLGVQDGTTFDFITPPTNKLDYIPEPTLATAVPLAAVYIDSSTASITWSSMYDLRVFLLGSNRGTISNDGSGTATAVTFWANATTITGDDSNFHWSTGTKSLLIGTNVNDYNDTDAAKLLIRRSTASGDVFSAIILNSNSGVPYQLVARSRGTVDAKTPLVANDVVGFYGFSGYSGSGWSSPAAIKAVAIDDFASGTVGTRIDFWPIPTAETTPARAFGIDKVLTSSQVVVTDSNGNLASVPYEDIGGGGGGGGEARRLARIGAAAGDTIFNLPDLGQTVYSININGFQLDPMIYTFSMSTNQITLDIALSADAVLVIDYEAQMR